MNKPDKRPDHSITQDIPLPGFYPCLTLQLNVTRYQSSGLGRFVMVVREPSEGVEIRRVFLDATAWDMTAQRVRETIAQMLVDLVWLQTGTNTTH